MEIKIYERGVKMNILEECSPKELKILELFAKSFAENPKELKENLLNSSLTDRARTLAFIKIRVPKLYEDIDKLLNA